MKENGRILYREKNIKKGIDNKTIYKDRLKN
jgi:hypothetical protein